MQTLRRLSLILLLALAAPSCALLKTPGTAPVPPATEQQILLEVHNSAVVLDTANAITRSAQDAVRTIYDLRKPDGGRYLTPQQFGAFANVFEEIGLETKDAAERLKDLNTPTATRRQLAQSIADKVSGLLNRLGALDNPTAAAVATALRATFDLVLVPRL